MLAATEQAYNYAGGSPLNATDPSGLNFDIPGYVDPIDNVWDVFQREARLHANEVVPGDLRFSSTRGSGEDFGIYRAPCSSSFKVQADIGARFGHGKGYNDETDAATAFVETILASGPTVAVNAAGGLVGAIVPNQPPLKLIHDENTLSQTSLEFWRNKSTDEIIDSLKPGASDEELATKPDGKVLNGNTRLTVLKERSIDIDKLNFPRTIYP